MPGSIQFIVQDCSNAFKERRKLRTWLAGVIKREGFELGELSFVLMSDDSLLEYNAKYLNHHYFTDVITFDNSENNKDISGDILISLDRVKDNAHSAGVNSQAELKRVMVHGLLHLCGHKDKTAKMKEAMRSLEDKHLAFYGR